MRSYVIKSKDQDISHIPLNSFVYHNGCGFIKRNETTKNWSSEDFERIYCTSNAELNPVIQTPKQAVALKDACCLRFVINGAFDFEKGATITEIILKDILGNNIPLDASSMMEATLANDEFWNNSTEWGFRNLFNGITSYIDNTTGANSSTLFNFGIENYEKSSEFYIKLPEEYLEVLDSVNIIAGSPEGRVPQSIEIYAVFDKNIPETRRETLIFLKTFTAEIDGQRPASTFKGTQKVNPADPCATLFYNGMNQDGSYLVLNQKTGLLQSIYCDFPPVFIALDPSDPAYTNLMNELCSQDPRTEIILKNPDDTYTQIKISEYFQQQNWICEFKGCEGLSNTEYASCIKTACDAAKRNPLTMVRYLDDNFNVVESNIIDYLASKNAMCVDSNPNMSFDEDTAILTDNYFTSIGQKYKGMTYEEALAAGFIGDYTRWLEYLEFINAQNKLISDLDNVIENTGYSTDGFITIIDPATGKKLEITAAEYKDLILDQGSYEKTEEPTEKLIATISNPTVYINDNTNNADVPDKMSIDLENVTNMDKNNIQVIDSLGAVEWHIEEEIIEVPLFDPLGKPLLDENGLQKSEIQNKIKIVIDKIELPDGYDTGGTTQIIISDGKNTYTLNLEVKEDKLSIEEYSSQNKRWTKPMTAVGSSGYIFKKKFEWDESGVAIRFYGAKGTVRVENLSNKFETNVKMIGVRDGLITIKPLLTKNDIKFVHTETAVITDGSETFDINLFVTSHIRLNSATNTSGSFDLGYKIVDDGVITNPIFNADDKPLIFNSLTYTSYLGGISGRDYCRNIAANLNVIDNQESIDDTDKYLSEITPYAQRLMGNTYYLVDPYFNNTNAKAGLIDAEDINVINMFVKLDKKLTSTKYDFKLNKYRHVNSKNNFTHYKDTFSRDGHCGIYDFKLFHQADGLTMTIENPNILSVGYGVNCSREDEYWVCQHGGAAPKKFRINTGEDKPELGNTKITFTDAMSKIDINVEVYQMLDISLNTWNGSHHTFPLKEVGSSVTIDLLHPWDNNWDNVVAWSLDEKKVEVNVNTTTKKLEMNFNFIGQTYVYVSDGHDTHKIQVESAYSTVFQTAFRRIYILNNDFEWKYVDLINVKGTTTIDHTSYNSDMLLVEEINNTQFRFKNLTQNYNVNTTISISDTAADGITTSQVTVYVVDSKKYVPTNITLNPDREVIETIDNQDGSITYKYSDGSSLTVWSDNRRIETPPPIHIEGTWSIVNVPEGVSAWFDEDGKLQIKSSIGGLIIITIRNDLDGTIKKISIYISPEFIIDTTPIIFDNNDINIEEEQ